MRKVKSEEEEIPKSVLKMKQEKEKREAARMSNAKYSKANINNRGSQNSSNRKNSKSAKNSRANQNKKNKKNIKRKIILSIILILLIILGIYLGVSAYKWKGLSTAMFTNKNSVVLDKSGEVIAQIGNEQKKITVDIEEMPQNLKDAYVSIEDERFYSHHGIDIKRTGGAILSYITSFGNSSYGGSTITQQLVKNLTGDTTDSITRKVKEWWKAFLLESYFSKEEILEMYLNVIYVGPNVYGVQSGAKYYFNKDVKDLSLAECAFMAGINNSPNYYNPFNGEDNEDDIKDRTLTVLQKMLELGKIDDIEYKKAEEEVKSGLEFSEGKIEIGDCIYSYHTDALINEVIEDLSKEKNISEEFAKNYLYLSGSTIYSTQDSSMQDKVEAESMKNQYILYSSNGEDTSQAAMVILNHQTGEVLACTGGLRRERYF